MKTHVTVVATIRIVFGTIGLMAFLAAGLVLGYLKGFILEHNDIPETIMPLLEGIIVFIFTIGFLSCLAGLIGGIALLARKNWGRILTIVISALSLINIPVGTLIGAYSIWVLMQDETIAMFRKDRYGTAMS